MMLDFGNCDVGDEVKDHSIEDSYLFVEMRVDMGDFVQDFEVFDVIVEMDIGYCSFQT